MLELADRFAAVDPPFKTQEEIRDGWCGCPGWAVFECNTAWGEEIERCDECERFESDTAALEYVFDNIKRLYPDELPTVTSGCDDKDCELCLKRELGPWYESDDDLSLDHQADREAEMAEKKLTKNEVLGQSELFDRSEIQNWPNQVKGLGIINMNRLRAADYEFPVIAENTDEDRNADDT